MRVKRFLSLSLAVLLICVIAFQATSCGLVADYINSLATLDSTDEVTTEVTEETTTQVTENTIPFVKTPDIEVVKLPGEQFSDSIEREASEIIDDAISKAISYVNAMKDDRHSNVCFSFDEDANGYLSALTPEQKDLYDRFVSAGKNFNHLSVTDKEYKGDLKKAYFALYEPMTYCEPGLASYFTLDATSHLNQLSLVGSSFFK